MRVRFIALLFMMLVTGCSAIGGEDTQGTAVAENASYLTESASINATMRADRASINITAQAAETEVAMIDGVNVQLVRTLERVVTPTPPLTGALEIDPTAAAEFEGERLFVKTGLSSEVDPNTGCVINPRVTFNAQEDRIYATMQVFNIEAGVPLRSEWYFQGELVYDFEFSSDQFYEDWCVWFFIDPTIVDFTPGSWTVRLYGDGFQLEDALAFQIEEPMNDG